MKEGFHVRARLAIENRIALALRAIHPSYASFLSGIMATVAIEIYEQVALFNKLELFLGVIGGSLMLFSAIMLTSLSLSLQKIMDGVTSEAPSDCTPQEKEAIYLEKINDSISKLTFVFFLSILLAGFGLLTVGFAHV
jgi:hypothetical protein